MDRKAEYETGVHLFLNYINPKNYIELEMFSDSGVGMWHIGGLIDQIKRGGEVWPEWRMIGDGVG